MNISRTKKMLSSIRKQISELNNQCDELRKMEQLLVDEINNVIPTCTIAVASKEFGVPNQTLRTWIRSGYLGSIKEGHKVLINRSQAEDLAIQKGYYAQR
ncbi:MAG: hypothetical protein SPK24_03615 [Candidatus Limisoma sp.]|nr:hypothetical protein [Candidatus Limisoma sp.]